MTKEQALDVNWLKSNAKLIHFFGLGFIQIKINEQFRVHVYTDKFTSTVTEEDVHNHRYDFTSQVLKGSLTQKLYKVEGDRDGHYLKSQESCDPSNKVESDATFADMKLISTQQFAAGSSYSIDHDTFHRVHSVDAVTLLNRGAYKKSLAEIVYHYEDKPTCPFSVKVSQEELWKVVEEALK